VSDTTQPERIMEPNYWPGWAQKVAELKAELEEVTERWLTRSAEVDTLKTKCANYQRQVGRMVERQDYEDRCERIAELESENRMRMGEAIERRGRIAELETRCAEKEEEYRTCMAVIAEQDKTIARLRDAIEGAIEQFGGGEDIAERILHAALEDTR